MLDTIDPIEAN